MLLLSTHMHSARVLWPHDPQVGVFAGSVMEVEEEEVVVASGEANGAREESNLTT